MGLSRRAFLKLSLYSGLFYLEYDRLWPQFSFASYPLKKADYFHTSENRNIICDLCHHGCEIPSGGIGICHSRIHKDGQLYTLTYGYPVAIHKDPIEKIPMRHVLPGSKVLCIGTAGCNFACLYCINHHISQKSPGDVESLCRTSEEIVTMALQSKVPAIAFTYNEPTIAYEFMHETFSLSKKQGLKTFFHTNGFIKPDPLKSLLKVTDGVVVDLKAYSPSNYRNLTNGEVKRVEETLKLIYSNDCFLEVVNLLVPDHNDSTGEIESLCGFIKKELSDEIPVHFSRFFPNYRLSDLAPTPSSTIKKAVDIAKQNGLKFVYVNNISTPPNDTRCPGCGNTIIQQQGMRAPKMFIENGHCSFCSREIPGIWRA